MLRERIGKFRIIRWIGGGQFSDVFLAVDTIISKEFALKIPRQRSKDIEMLKQEARVLASLDHSNIVRFYSIEEFEGSIILVMEYVDGVSLRTHLDNVKKIPMEEAVSIIVNILKGLDYAHQRGILHRDLKPENILITHDGKVKITDFGLAKIKTGISVSLSVAGTPIYMSPEAWKGEFDRFSDIYSTGVILYEMLNGSPPFVALSFERMRDKILHGKLKKIRGIPPFIWAVIKKSMARNPKNRYSTCMEFINDVRKGARGYTLEIHGTLKDIHKKSSILDGLTPQQKETVLNGSGIVVLFGSAGTGKTYTLARRVAYLIKEKHVEVEKILAITFTGRAATNLKQEIFHLIGELNTKKLWAGTFHQMAMRIFSMGAERLGFDEEEIKVISPEDVLSLIESLSGAKARGIKKAIERAKTNLLGPDEYKRLAGTSWEKHIANVYKSYQNFLRSRNMVDYGDIIMYAVRILEEYEDIRKELSQKFEYIFVDEFQDIDSAQFKLLHFLSGTHNNLFLVGDDDQSIYGFRGANPEFIKNLEEIYPDKVKRFYLTTSFRVPQNILKAAEHLISFNRDRISKPMISRAKSKGNIVFNEVANEKDEAEWVSDVIKREVENGLQFDDIGVIYRVNAYSRLFEEVFIKEEIPYNMQSEGGFYEREEIRSVLALLKLVLNIVAYDDIFLITKRFFNTSSKVSKKIAGLLTGKKTRVILSEGEKEQVSELKDKLLEFKRQYTGEMLDEITPKDIIEAFLDGVGYFDRLGRVKSSAKIQEKENIFEFMEFLSAYETGEHNRLLNDVNLLRRLGIESRSERGVRLMTVHQAKGLEFPCVFVVGLYEGGFPLLSKYGRDNDLEEERRLFYVAVTRSQGELYLSYPKFKYGKYRNEPSIFVTEMFLKNREL